MGLSDELRSIEEVAKHAADVRFKRERDSALLQVSKLQEQLDKAEKALAIVQKVENAELQPPSWLSPVAKRAKSAATLVLMLSDTHFDEVVLPDEVDGLNAYNRQIATLRVQRWVQNVVKLARHHLAGTGYGRPPGRHVPPRLPRPPWSGAGPQPPPPTARWPFRTPLRR